MEENVYWPTANQRARFFYRRNRNLALLGWGYLVALGIAIYLSL